MTGFWIAFAGLAFTIVCTMAGAAFKLGAHSQRINQNSEDIKKLQDADDKAAQGHVDIAVLSHTMLTMKESLTRLETSFGERIDQLNHDIRGLLTGRIKPATSRDKAE